MSNNIDGLNEVESSWVCRFMQSCRDRIEFTESAPSEAAANYIIKTFKDMGY